MTAVLALDGSRLRPGVRVRCERAEPARGTWHRYAGRAGTVASINVQTFDEGSTYAEVGVSFGADRHGATWFLPSELVSPTTAATRPPEPRKAPGRVASHPLRRNREKVTA